nr:rRNA 2'-O-methyltransferase fibrillarin-like [Arachis hypogaea]
MVGVGWCWRQYGGDVGRRGGEPWWRQGWFGGAGLGLGYREGKEGFEGCGGGGCDGGRRGGDVAVAVAGHEGEGQCRSGGKKKGGEGGGEKEGVWVVSRSWLGG